MVIRLPTTWSQDLFEKNGSAMAEEKSFRDIQVRSSEIGIRKIGLNDLWQSLKEGYDDFNARPTIGFVLTVLLYFLFAMSWAASADNTKPLTTMLLVAQAELRDPNFKGSVVLVMNNIGPAPAGIIINRPTSIAVSRLFPDLERLARLDDKVYFGGPVEIAMVSFLVRADGRSADLHWLLGLGVRSARGRDCARRLDPRARRGERDLRRKIRAALARAADA